MSTNDVPDLDRTLREMALKAGQAGLATAKPFTDPTVYSDDVREAPYVVVIGAGVTGLTVAHELAERGFGVQVVEPAIGKDGDLDVGGLAATQYAEPSEETPCAAGARSGLSARALERTRVPASPPVTLPVGRPRRAERLGGVAWDPDKNTFQLSDNASRQVDAVARSALSDAIARFASAPRHERAPVLRLKLRPRLAPGIGGKNRRGAHLAAADAAIGRLYGMLREYEASRLGIDHAVRVEFDRAPQEQPKAFTLNARSAPEAERRARAEWEQDGPPRRMLLRVEVDLPDDFDCICESSVQMGVQPVDWVPGEHGYRFFPSFYRHVFDTMRRTPVFDEKDDITHRSTYDNLVPTVVQGIAYAGAERRFVHVRRDRPASFEDFRELQRDLYDDDGLRFSEADMARYQLELFRYMTACSDRREAWSQDPTKATWWDFVGAEAKVPVGPADPYTGDRARGPRYTDAFREHLKVTSLALVAMDEKEIDTRTYGNIGVQLLLDQVAMGGQTDMTLNGPTSEAWFKHWKTYLQKVGVRFYKARLTGLSGTPTQPVDLDAGDPATTPWSKAWPVWGGDFEKHQRMEHPDDQPDSLPDHEAGLVQPAVTFDRDAGFTDGVQPEPDGHPHRFNHYDDCGDQQGNAFDPDYYVIAMPLDRLWRVFDEVSDPDRAFPPGSPMRRVYEWLCYVRDEDFGTNVDATTAAIRYDKEHPWYEDQGRHGPFRHFSGVQYYFDADNQYHPGHTYFPDAAWGLSSISQAQFWHGVRIWQVGFRGLLSVDIGDMTSVDPHPEANASAWGLPPEKIALASWRQMTDSIDLFLDGREPPWPRHFHLDAHLLFSLNADLTVSPALGEGWLIRNTAPFLINRPPIWRDDGGSLVLEWDEWAQRPGTVHTAESTDPGHIGRKHIDLGVSWGRWIIAGPHTKTFTRLTTMEAANESGRHAVNTLLAHLARLNEPADVRPQPDHSGRDPYKGYRSAGLLMGDFASTWDLEDNEIPDLSFWKRVDEKLMAQGLPHMVEILDLHRKLDDWLDTVDQLRDDAVLAGLVAQTATEDWTDLPGLLVPGVADLLSKIVKPT